jgi:hypothetical protein
MVTNKITSSYFVGRAWNILGFGVENLPCDKPLGRSGIDSARPRMRDQRFPRQWEEKILPKVNRDYLWLTGNFRHEASVVCHERATW